MSNSRRGGNRSALLALALAAGAAVVAATRNPVPEGHDVVILKPGLAFQTGGTAGATVWAVPGMAAFAALPRSGTVGPLPLSATTLDEGALDVTVVVHWRLVDARRAARLSDVGRTVEEAVAQTVEQTASAVPAAAVGADRVELADLWQQTANAELRERGVEVTRLEVPHLEVRGVSV